MLEHRTTRTVGRASGKASAAEPVERYLAKAATHRASGRFDKARRNLQLALEAAPGHAAAHFELGVFTSRIEAPASAVPHFVAALRAAPERPANWLALASTLLTLNRVSEARALMERFREIDIALDFFPYNGGTTSCDTLAMGVPLIALAGTHAAAHGHCCLASGRARGARGSNAGRLHGPRRRPRRRSQSSARHSLRASRTGLRQRADGSRPLRRGGR